MLIRNFKDYMSRVLEMIIRCYSGVGFNVSYNHLLIDGTVRLRQQMYCIMMFLIFLFISNQLHTIEGWKQLVSFSF